MYAKKLDSIDEVDKFIERQTTKTDSREVENLNRPITSRGWFGKHKENARTRWHHWWILPNFKRIIAIFHNFFKKKKIEEGVLTPWFYEAHVAMIPKPDKSITGKECCRPMSFMNTCAKY